MNINDHIISLMNINDNEMQISTFWKISKSIVEFLDEIW